MAEKVIQAGIQLEATKSGMRLFRNQVGSYVLSDGRRISSGLCVGSSDLIGWTPMEITQDMVGKTVAVFTAIEVKDTKRKEVGSPEQEAFIGAVVDSGGVGFVANSVPSFLTQIEDCLNGRDRFSGVGRQAVIPKQDAPSGVVPKRKMEGKRIHNGRSKR